MHEHPTYIAQLYIVINVTVLVSEHLTETNRLNGLKAQIRFSSKKLISFNANLKQ
jgi:hypothetical protein